MPAPGQRLVADAQPAAMRLRCHLGKVGGGALRIVDRSGADVAAHQQQIGAERLHHVELALRTIQVSPTLRFGHRLEVAKRLEDRDGQAESVGDRAHILGRAVIGEQIVFEDFDAVEADRRRRPPAFPAGCR